MVRKWEKVSSEFLIENKIFKLREDKVISPKKESEHPVWVIDTPNWVNIIPITENNEVILVNQHRFGTEQLTLEIPGGMVDEGEDPMIAANLMLKLKRLEIPKSGTGANLSLLDQLPHDELHNLFREQGIELGDLDIGEYMKAIGDSVAKGETSINEMFDILDVYADVVMPYLKQKTEAAGPAFKNIKGFDETVKSYAKGTDVTLGRVEKPVKSKTKQKTIPNKPNKNGTRTKKR